MELKSDLGSNPVHGDKIKSVKDCISNDQSIIKEKSGMKVLLLKFQINGVYYGKSYEIIGPKRQIDEDNCFMFLHRRRDTLKESFYF